MNLVRRIGTGLAVTTGLLVLSAVPAEARPLLDSPVYEGPAGADPMAVWGYVAVVAAVWVVLAGMALIAWAAVGVGLKRPRPIVVRATCPPPVPPPPVRDTDEPPQNYRQWMDWLADQPVDSLSDFELSVRFWQIAEDAL